MEVKTIDFYFLGTENIDFFFAGRKLFISSSMAIENLAPWPETIDFSSMGTENLVFLISEGTHHYQ